MTRAIRTGLWVKGRGREAAEFYCSLIPNSRIEAFCANDSGGPYGDMHFQVIDLSLNGVPYQLLTARPMFPLSECVSILVAARDRAEIDRLCAALVEAGGKHGPCGWLKDRFRLSWQIVPDPVRRLLTQPDKAWAARVLARVLACMMTMGKIDPAAAEAANS